MSMHWVQLAIAFYFGGCTLMLAVGIPTLRLMRDDEQVQKMGPATVAVKMVSLIASWPWLVLKGFYKQLFVPPKVAEVLVTQNAIRAGDEMVARALEAEALQVFKPNFCDECRGNFDRWYDERKKREMAEGD